MVPIENSSGHRSEGLFVGETGGRIDGPVSLHSRKNFAKTFGFPWRIRLKKVAYMPSPFAVQCPSCQTKLKIQSPDAVGKKVRCPKCETVFRVNEPKVAAPKRSKPKPPADDFGVDDFEDYEDYEDDGGFDDFEAPPSRRRSPSKPAGRSSSSKAKAKSGGSRKKKSKKKSSGGGPSPLLIGGSAAAAVLLIAILIFAFSGGGSAATGSDGNVVEMTYLPADMVGFVYVDWQKVIGSPDFTKIESIPGFQQGVQELTKTTGMTINDVGSITVGLVGAAPGSGEPIDENGTVAVIRLRTPLNRIKLDADPSATKTDYNGQTIYGSTGDPTQLVLLGNDDVLVFAQKTPVIQKVIDQGTASARRTQFDFVDNTQAVFGAFVPTDPAALRSQMFSGGPPQLPPLMPAEVSGPLQAMLGAFQSDLEGFGFGASFPGSQVGIKLQVKCTSSTATGTIATSGNQLLSFLRDSAEKNKALLPADQHGNIDQIMGSLAFSDSGDSAAFSMSLPTGMIEMFAKNGMPNMPIPGLDLGGNPFGGNGNPLGQSRDAAKRATSKNNLKQMGLAFHNYHATFKSLPVTKQDPSYFDDRGQPKLSWRVHLLPFLEEVPLYEQFHLDEPWDSPHNRSLLQQMPEVFKSPSVNARPGHTVYLGVKGPGAIFENGSGTTFAEIRDGTSNTIIVVEATAPRAVPWTKPDDFPYDPANPTGGLVGAEPGFHALLCDGSVRFISRMIDPQTLVNLFQRNDGNPLGNF